jgi:hypothetical protein
MSASRIELISVTSDWTSDPEFFDGRTQQGPIYFRDCLSFVDRAAVAVTHIQFMYAAVDAEGAIRRPPLALDIHYRAEPGQVRNDFSNCRDYAYGTGDRGLWLVAWVNVVDFADGTSWHAPPSDQLHATIEEALPHEP